MANTFEVFLENGLFKAVINRNFAQQMIRHPWLQHLRLFFNTSNLANVCQEFFFKKN